MASDVERMLHAMARLRTVVDIPTRLLGMRRGEFAALMTLAEHARCTEECKAPALTATQLAREIDISAAAVSQIISSLEAKAYVRRVPDPKDRRRVRVELLPAGKSTVQCAEQQVCMLLDGVLEQMGEKDARLFVDLVEKLSALVNAELHTSGVQPLRSGPVRPDGKESGCEDISAI